MENRLFLSIGDCGIRFSSRGFSCHAPFGPAYSSFVLSRSRSCRLEFNVVAASHPPRNFPEPFFNIDYAWSLGMRANRFFYQDRNPTPEDGFPLRSAVISKDLRCLTVYADPLARRDTPLLDWILDIPLGQVIMSWLLAQQEGILMHGCGVIYRGKGIIFSGASGSGKSTLAELWKKKKGACVVSDERVIVRRKKGSWWLYGTPWAGSSNLAANRCAALDRIYFIGHGKRNVIRDAGPAQVINQCLQNMRIPLWEARMASSTLERVRIMLQEMPLFSLRFVPKYKVIDELCRRQR